MDILRQKAIIWEEDTLGARFHEEEVPADMVAEAARHREILIETVADADDALLEQYLAGETISEDAIAAAIATKTRAIDLVPVLCGSALRNKGIQPLLDAVVSYLPPPTRPVQGTTADGEKREWQVTDDIRAALAFKTMHDPFSGQLTFIRLYSGTLKTGDQVYNPRTSRTERLGRLVRMHANKKEDIESAGPGGIFAAIGLQEFYDWGYHF